MWLCNCLDGRAGTGCNASKEHLARRRQASYEVAGRPLQVVLLAMSKTRNGGSYFQLKAWYQCTGVQSAPPDC